MIRDQVIEKCASHRLRRKRLETKKLTLDIVRQTAQTIEFSEKQALAMEGKESHVSAESVNKIDSRYKNKLAKKTLQSDTICYACGRRRHMKRDVNCPDRKGYVTNVVNRDTLRKCVKTTSLIAR
jgi:hypothetical protein